MNIRQTPSLDMKMPNGKRFGDCTFAEMANTYTIDQLMSIYPDLWFWARLVDSEQEDATKERVAQKTPRKAAPSRRERTDGSQAGFIDDDEDKKLTGVHRRR